MRPRSASPADAAGIAALDARVAERPWGRDGIDTVLSAPTAWCWLTDGDDAPLAYLLGHAVADEAEVYMIGVAPEARRRGLARALLTAALEVWAARGGRSAHLDVREDNAAARGLYEALGWRRVGRRARYYGDVDALLYRWEP